MTLLERYLNYLSQICEGSRTPPEGILLTRTGDMEKAVELQQQIAGLGIPEFVKRCAAQEAPAEEEAQPEPVKTEIRDIYEVFLDSVCLEDNLLSYLIDILKRGAKDEFQTLSHAAARTLLDMDEFLLWLGNKEAFAGPDERACAAIMDGCLNRLKIGRAHV